MANFTNLTNSGHINFVEEESIGDSRTSSQSDGRRAPFQISKLSSDTSSMNAGNEAQQYPEIFEMGGNIKLNKELYSARKGKLKFMATRSPIIECQDLGKNYNLKGENLVVALNSVTLEGTEKYGAIKQGEFVIIRGPSGGGKTTFLNLLGTIDSSTHGTLSTLHLYSEIEGKEINSTTTDAELSRLRRECIGIVFQTFNLLALMSAYENIELPMRIRGVLKEKEMKERTKMLLKRVGLSERADHLPSELSGGEQQRVAIARSLANAPAIILLDEPTGDLDSKSTIEVMNLLLEINNFGYAHNEASSERADPITIVMVTHNEDLECYGDRIIFFEDGKIRKQVLNQYQFSLDAGEYNAFLNTKV